MPIQPIISRIKQIESRISDIQQMGQIQKNIQNESTPKIDRPSGEKFSEIMQEVQRYQDTQELAIMGNEGISPSNLSANRMDSLLEIYKQAGSMPIAQPKPIIKNIINDNNPGTWDGIIMQIAKDVGIDPKLIHAVIQTESAYNPNAISRVGAEGLMQLMPATAQDLGVNDSFEPMQNIRGGATYLKQMLEHYNGDLIKALAAYNAGPDAVDRHKGIPPYKETQNYVPKVLNYYYNMNNQ